MKKSKIFMTTGALVLAVSAIFAAKANRKFALVKEAKTSNPTGTYIIEEQTAGTPFYMTTRTGGTSGQLIFELSNGNGFFVASFSLVTVGDFVHPVYYKP